MFISLQTGKKQWWVGGHYVARGTVCSLFVGLKVPSKNHLTLLSALII